MDNNKKIIVALDNVNLEDIQAINKHIDNSNVVWGCKVGLGLYLKYGLEVIELLNRSGNVFLDLKFHDIPHQLKTAMNSVVSIKVDMFTIHASGGPEMMKTVVNEVAEESEKIRVRKPIVLAVTMLTSLNDALAKEIGFSLSVKDSVKRLAATAAECGVDGIVCSPHEIEEVRKIVGPEIKIVTPGIRPGGKTNDDQKRVMTPSDAVSKGADFLVIGRPITEATDPIAVLKQIESEIS